MTQARTLADFVAGTTTITGNPTFSGTVAGAGESWTKTAAQTTSGAATYTFSSIPSTVSELYVIGSQVSRGTSSSSAVIRLGDSGGLETTGYSSSIVYSYNGGFYINTVSDRAGCEFCVYDSAKNFVCHIWNTSGNKWLMQMQSHAQAGDYNWIETTVEKELSATLDRVALVDKNGTNFDGGSAQVWYK